MKKILSTLIATTMVLSMVACGSSEDSSSKTETAKKETTTTTTTTTKATTTTPKTTTTKATSALEVEKEDEIVAVTIPASLILDLDGAIENAKNDPNIVKYTVNDDGSMTYHYKRAEYEKQMQEYKVSVENSIQELLTEYPVVTSIDHNEDLTEFTMTVTSEEDYTSNFVGFATLSVSLSAHMYQVFTGVKETVCIIHVVDANGYEFTTID